MSTATPQPSTPPKIGLESAGVIMTPEEFDAITDYDELYNYELIHGVLVVNPIPSPGETDPNEQLGLYFRVNQQSHPQGKCIDKTLSEQYIRTSDSRRKADRVVWVGLGRTPNPREDIPAIVIEFVSRSKRDFRRDYVEKRREYIDLGIKEYWIIERFQRTMTVYRPQEPEESVIAESDTYTTELLPGFELPLAEILALADDWNGN